MSLFKGRQSMGQLVGAPMTAANGLDLLTPEGLEDAFWRLCGSWSVWEAAADQWWIFVARCSHGEWHGESAGLPGLTEAMRSAFVDAQREHDVVPIEDN